MPSLLFSTGGRRRVRLFRTDWGVRDLQLSLKGKVEKANSEWTGKVSKEDGSLSPISPEEVEERDAVRVGMKEALTGCLHSGREAVSGLQGLSASMEVEGDEVSVEALADRLGRALDGLCDGSVASSPDSESLSEVPLEELCEGVVTLGEKWVMGRKGAVEEVRSTLKAAKKRSTEAFAQMLEGEAGIFPDACEELERAQRAETELARQMMQLQDNVPRGRRQERW
mmetsp:Transcript_4631/g.9304  ORF Transcript_4631/g.9304 Transcript_4631/m.9304 type:complete len:226 (+) Transcript_4631:157-834(+)